MQTDRQTNQIKSKTFMAELKIPYQGQGIECCTIYCLANAAWSFISCVHMLQRPFVRLSDKSVLVVEVISNLWSFVCWQQGRYICRLHLPSVTDYSLLSNHDCRGSSKDLLLSSLWAVVSPRTASAWQKLLRLLSDLPVVFLLSLTFLRSSWRRRLWGGRPLQPPRKGRQRESRRNTA